MSEYVADNDLGTANLLRALHRRAFGGSIVLASSMVVYGEGRYRCATHGIVRPGRRRAVDLAAGRYEPPCPVCDAAHCTTCCGVPAATSRPPPSPPSGPRSIT